MDSPHKPNGKFLSLWPVIVVAAAALIGYGSLQTRVSAAEQEIAKVEKKAEQADSRIAVAKVETEVKALKEQVKEANDKLDRLLERSR